jgi:histidinol-phosphate aminotransferase
MAFGQGGVMFPDISYGFYKVYGELYGLDCQEIPLKEDFSLDYQDYCGKGRMVVIANPNAPTGLSIPLEQIEEILKSNPDNVVLIDEAYVDFGGESAYPLMGKYENLLVVRTFSKSRCLAGGRLGYAIGPKGLIEDLEKIKFSTNPYNLDRLTLTLGEATVEADDYYRQMCREIIRVREWTAAELRDLGFAVLNSNANFLFAKTDKMAGGELYQALKARGILVRHFSAPRIKDYVRITIGTAEQMKTFVDTLKEILN